MARNSCKGAGTEYERVVQEVRESSCSFQKLRQIQDHVAAESMILWTVKAPEAASELKC